MLSAATQLDKLLQQAYPFCEIAQILVFHNTQSNQQVSQTCLKQVNMKIVSSSWIKFDINLFKFREERAEAGRCAQKNEILRLGVQQQNTFIL